MLRVGMTNPPYILEHLEEIAEVLRHPCVYSFLHVPVQSGSDAVLTVSASLSYQLRFLYAAAKSSIVLNAEDNYYIAVLY